MNQRDYSIRLETKKDYKEVENVTREAFWNVYRPGCMEHYVLHCYRGREDFIKELDFVMEQDGKILDYSMQKAKEMGAGALCIEGNIDFYGKSGFVVASTKGIHYYAEPRENEVPYFLVKELEEGFLDDIEGIYHTPEGYFVDEKEVEIFDQQFPKKEKLKLPGQLA